MRMGRHIVFALALLLAISCGGRKKAAVPVALQDRGTVSELFGHRV